MVLVDRVNQRRGIPSNEVRNGPAIIITCVDYSRPHQGDFRLVGEQQDY